MGQHQPYWLCEFAPLYLTCILFTQDQTCGFDTSFYWWQGSIQLHLCDAKSTLYITHIKTKNFPSYVVIFSPISKMDESAEHSIIIHTLECHQSNIEDWYLLAVAVHWSTDPCICKLLDYATWVKLQPSQTGLNHWHHTDINNPAICTVITVVIWTVNEHLWTDSSSFAMLPDWLTASWQTYSWRTTPENLAPQDRIPHQSSA